jgi:hypothetical protein
MAVAMFEAWVELLFEIAKVPEAAVPLLPPVNCPSLRLVPALSARE